MDEQEPEVGDGAHPGDIGEHGLQEMAQSIKAKQADADVDDTQDEFLSDAVPPTRWEELLD